MNELFIVLIRPHTGLGSIARKIGGYEYTHIAVSLDRSFTDFISYSRRYHYFPFDAGFAHEYRDYYAFDRHSNVKIKAFRLLTDDSCYAEIMKYISNCENDSDEVFNLFSMATMLLIHGFRIYKANNCMSFTAKIIELSRCVKMEKPYYKYSIQDMDKLLSGYKFFEGKLSRSGHERNDDYMKPFKMKTYITDMIRLFGRLIYRMLFRHNSI
ncbi:hypothetical protein [Ruminococcus flavefaciens]|uniref:hypothetical protein n=1 Tax=Ruminococcus flavefaciens TaxID=1265 RepID=UPI0026ECB16C|nr:hypothetical protein [Ruminococcus flavefaciens]MDD7515803.1 hypothetical protein [Ruminococcus flavefaciens]MDY5691308.1 hypothetical protein [Ruminococcus flavefaciens]